MTCEDMEMRMTEYWNGTLSVTEEAACKGHLAACEACRAETERLGSLWRDLGQLPLPEPSPAVRERFHAMFAAQRYENARPGRPAFQWVWQAAAAVVLVLGGSAAGYSLRSNRMATAEVAQLREEVGGMRQLVALSLLQEQSASERLSGVSWAYRVEPSDTQVLSALLTAVNHDPNVNVRLAAVDALRPFAASQSTRDSVMRALPAQTDPIVQVALIDLLVDLKEKEAAPALERVAMDGSTDVGVRQRAQWALERLQ